MGDDGLQFCETVIRPVLNSMNERLGTPQRFNSPSTVKLLAMIAAHESHFIHREQIGGPALSYYQIEPRTLDDLYVNYLSYRPAEMDLLRSYVDGVDRYQALKFNDAYATCAARLILWREPAPLPDYEDEEGLSRYAKRVWNTDLGAATPQKYFDDFKTFGPGDNYWQSLS